MNIHFGKNIIRTQNTTGWTVEMHNPSFKVSVVESKGTKNVLRVGGIILPKYLWLRFLVGNFLFNFYRDL
jgi:hypothetical protein